MLLHLPMAGYGPSRRKPMSAKRWTPDSLCLLWVLSLVTDAVEKVSEIELWNW